MKASTPILVTGSHRSGSTWAGRMLSAAPHVGYIHEPFNVDIKISVNPKPFKHQFQYIYEKNSEDYKAVLDGILHFRYPLAVNLGKIRTFMDGADLIRDQTLFLFYRLNNARPLIKDPLAFFSVEWLSRNFNMDVLVMIRHPAAFCSSLKIKNWRFDFNQLLKQPLLMDRYLEKFAEEIHEHAEHKTNLLDQAILLWNCIHHTVNIYRKNHPEWLFVRHEDVSLDPVNQFKMIYDDFGLEFTRRVEKKIKASCGAHNPVEQEDGREFFRDSKRNIYNWKERLTSDEIRRIKRKTSNIATLFYSQDEW